MAGRTATLSAYISNSLLTTVTWTAYYAGSTDVWTSSTQIATGTFTVTSSVTQYSAQISIPSAATTGIQVIFSVGAQTSGTFVLSNPQLEVGSSATGFEYVDYTTQLAMCQRYYWKQTGASGIPALGAGFCYNTTSARICIQSPVQMRSGPSYSYGGTIYILKSDTNGNLVTSLDAVYVGLISAMVQFTGSGGGLAAGDGTLLCAINGAANYIDASAEL